MNVGEHSFLQFFDQSLAAQLIAQTEERTFQDQEMIFEEGACSNHIFLILEGTVELIKRDSANNIQIIAYCTENDYFGEFGILDGEPRSAGARAVGKVKTATISRQSVLSLLNISPGESIIKLASHIINIIRENNQRYVEERLRRERMTMVGEMANAIIHDFKNPFTVIRMAAFSIDGKYNDPDTKKLCKLIDEQIERMRVMADEVLDFSRGRARLNMKIIDMNDLLQRFEKLVGEYLRASLIDYVFTGVSKVIMADDDKLLRVLQNLVTNATEAFVGKPGKITIEIHDKGETVLLEVKDNGPGIPPEIKSRIYDPFVTHGKEKGLGLGMAITKNIIESHHGVIDFDSEPGRGTTFRITLPYRQPSV